ncbi:MAG: DUF2971 domain-containing protein [Betaproteobacteria bacterium]|nr:DUF2971 domain-containing protein [Betaproteobacteria bacterium]
METSGENVRIPLGLTDIRSHSLFVLSPPEQLFHYTSLDGARGIITSKSLHLTKAGYLNDRSELTFAIRLFRGVAEQVKNGLTGSERKNLLAETAHQLGSFESTNICVASFCEDGDLLSQWRSYGRSGRGVALGFSGSVLTKISNTGWAHLFKCVYDLHAQRTIIENLIEMLLHSYDIAVANTPSQSRERMRKDIMAWFNTTFLQVAPVLKDKHFSEEREWRIVTMSRKTTDPKFQATVSSSRVSQYYSYEFQPNRAGEYDFLHSFTVGPTSDPELIGGAIQLLGMRENVLFKGTHYSQIPYRG